MLHREVRRREKVAGHQEQEKVLDPVTHHLSSNVPSEGHWEENGQDGTCQPVDMEPEQAEGQLGPGTDQQEELDDCENMARVEHPEELSCAQLVAQL